VSNKTSLKHEGAELLDEREAAEILTVEPGTLSVWRSTGRYDLPFVKIGRAVRYRRSALAAWMASREGTTTGAATSTAA
jgi:predicted DNA-binding transcriptional regulator AlpA